MVFWSIFALSGIAVSTTGFLMFAFPLKYVELVNWYLSKVGFRRPALHERYSRWPYRLSGLALFLISFLFFYVLAVHFKQ
jgi:hypothetical protein